MTRTGACSASNAWPARPNSAKPPPDRRPDTYPAKFASRGRNMSTLMDSVAGKGQNLSTRAWAAILVLSLIVFGANTLYATTKAARVGGASTAASNLQVNSQRLAVQSQEAVSGDADS